MLSLFFYSLCRHAECQWGGCRSKRQCWHLHSQHLKILVKPIMDFSSFSSYHRWTDAFQFQTWLKLPQCSHFFANGIQSQSNKTAFHGALQINVVWLIGYFLDSVFTCWTLTVLTGRRSRVSWSKSAQQSRSRRCLSCLTERIKDDIKQ